MDTGHSAVSQPDVGKLRTEVKNVTLSWEEGFIRKIEKKSCSYPQSAHNPKEEKKYTSQ